MSEQIIIASQNNIKSLAAQDAFKIFTDKEYAFVLADTEISSGVSDQPNTLSETATGALNRLSQIRKAGGYAFYIAIEGGTYGVDTPVGTLWYESACAAVADHNASSTPSVAFGPAFPVPRRIIRHVSEGLDLNQAMELETGIAEIGSSVGFNGWLTDNKLDRQAASSQAVLLALYGMAHE